MKYENAKDVLPIELLQQLQKYAAGKLLYVPIGDESKSWGELSGYRQKLIKRNQMIYNKFILGKTISELAEEYFLSVDSIKKILYGKKTEKLGFELTMDNAVKYSEAGMLEEWVKTYFMLQEVDHLQKFYLETDFIYFGICKMPLRLITSTPIVTNVPEGDNKDIPLIVRYDKKRFFADLQSNALIELRERKVNGYHAIILSTTLEEHKEFMKYFGRYFGQ